MSNFPSLDCEHLAKELRIFRREILLRGLALISKRWMFLLPLTFFFSILSGTGQTTNPPGALFETIKSLDAKLFDAYNHCNLETLGSWFRMILSSITIRQD
jgi:hypothetical protein